MLESKKLQNCSASLLSLFLLQIVSSPLLGQTPTFKQVATGDIATNTGKSMSASWGDFNSDDELDLFIANTGFDANFLYTGTGDSVFNRVTSGDIVNDFNPAQGGTWGDFNNDGHLDIFVPYEIPNNRLYSNKGNGSFTAVTIGEIVNDGGRSLGAAWGDYDNDGFLDLAVANDQGQNDFLYKNNGDGTFAKITAGPVVSDGADGTCVAWADYDSDGDLDLFVGNQNSQNNALYQNNGDGSFSAVTSGPVVNDGANTQGASWGDYDNDRDLDLFVANSGGANALYRNDGSGNFTALTTGPVVTDNTDAHGSAWGDFDNDGDLDLFVSTNSDAAANLFYENNGDGSFSSISGAPTLALGFATGASWADIDGDGDLDLFVAQDQGTANLLFVNEGASGNWLDIELTGVLTNKRAIGAKVLVYAEIDGQQVAQMHEISGQTGRGGQSDLAARFGLGDATNIDSIRIKWPSGVTQRLRNVAPNQSITVAEAVSLENLTFTPTEDSYIKIGDKDANFGANASSKVEKDKFITYIKFQVDGVIDDVLSAKVQLHAADNSDDGGTIFLAENTFKGSNEAWQEETLNALNAPNFLGLPLSALGGVALNDIVEFNITQAISGNGLFTFAIESNSVDDIKYFMKEGQTPPKLILQVIANEVNTPPVAEDDIASVQVNAQIDIPVTNNDTGVDDPLDLPTLTIVSDVSNGTTDIDTPSGTVTYTPSTDYLGPDSFTYTIRDEAGDISNLATVLITVRPPNVAPTANDDQAETTDQLAVGIPVLANDSDDSQLLPESVTIVSPPGRGAANVNPTTGAITYTPTSGALGTDSFTYTVNDNDGATSNEATVTIVVTKGPQLVTLTYNPTDDAQVRSLSPSGNFGSRTTMKVLGSEFTTYLKFNISGLIGNIQSMKLRLRVTDGSDNSSTSGGRIFHVSNDFLDNETPWTEAQLTYKNAPVTSRTHFAAIGPVTENTWVEIDVSSIVVEDGVYSFLVSSLLADLAKYYSKEGLFPPELVVTTLALVGNDPPVARDDDIKVRVNTPASFNPLDNDDDANGQLEPSTVNLTSQPGHGTVSVNGITGEITYAPDTDFLGSDSFNYTVEDNESALSNQATVTINVFPANVAPVATTDFATTFQDNPVAVDVLANDTDADGFLDPSTVAIQTQPSHGTAGVNSQTGVITYFPPTGFVGRDSIFYSASDDDGEPSNVAKVEIVIKKTPDVRVASFRPTDDAQVKVTEANENYGSRATTKIQADRFRAFLKFNISNLEGTVSAAKLRIQVTDFPDDGGPNGGSIYPVGNTFAGANIDWDESQLTFANSPDVSGAPLSTVGPVELNQIVEFDVTAAISGNGIFSFAILGNTSDEVKYFMKESLFPPSLFVETLVLVENQIPVAGDDFINARLNEVKTIDVTANDSDPDGAIDPTSVQVASQPAHGSVAQGGAPNLLTYTPNTDFIGVDQFTYRVRDFEGGVSNTATVTITIHPPNLPPEANDDVAATLSVFAVDIDVLANDVDNDGTISLNSVSVVIPPANGTVQINPTNGMVTYTPGNGFVGLETFTYTISDNDGLVSEPATVTITVSEAPAIITRTFGAREDGYVKANSAERFGTRSTAKVEKGRYRSYFKFDASDLEGQIKTATLQLTVTDGPDDGSSDGGSVFLVSNTFDGSSVPWNEDEINDPNSPAIDGAPLASVGQVAPNQVIAFDVSSAMREPGIYSFAVTNNSSNQVKYFTHEGIAAPRLIVEAFTAPENTPPFAVADDTTTGREQAILINVLKNDKDLDGSINPNTVHVASLPAHGTTLVAAGGFIRYTPNSGFLGSDSFTYTVEDEENAPSAEATVTISVVDNSNWSNLSTGLQFVVLAIAADNNEVYAAGTHAVNGTHHLFLWDGAWSEVTSNMNGQINAMEISNGSLYVAGDFTSIDGIGANRVARKTGNTWEALGDGLDGEVQTLAIDGDDLYVGGDFLNAGGNPAARVAHWNGTIWSALGDGFDDTAFAVALSGSQLFAGGEFQNTGSTQINYVAQWDGAKWVPLSNGVNGRVRDITRNGSGIFVAGDFTIAGLANAKGVAHWDGATWTGLAGGVNDPVRSIASSGTVLFAAGDFPKADGKRAPYSAKWDGKDWTPLGTGLDAPGRAVAADGNDIFFGGSFNAAGGAQVNHIAQWTEVNQPPIAVSDTFDTDINSAIEFDVLANDIDPNGNIDASSLAVLLQPLNGQIVVNGSTGRITYTPVQDFAGRDILEYQVSDSDGETSNTATVTVRVNPPNVAPIAVNDATSTPQDSPVAIDIIANDTDIDGSVVPATVQITSQTSNGAVALNPATGVVTYTPNPGYVGLDTFIYTIQDNEGATSNAATANIAVTRLQNASVDFRAVEDGMVKHNSTSRFGTRSTAKLTRDKFSIFLKFNVNGIEGEISRATLKLTVTDAEVDGSDDGGTLFQTSNDFDGTNTPWNEDDLNDPNSPARTSLPLASAGAVVTNQVVEFDVSNVVQQEGVYSFSLTSNSPDEAKYFTHESNHDPVLTVETLIAVENKPPVAVDDLANGRLNQPLTIDVTVNDSDPEGALNKNSATVAAQPTNGTLQAGPGAGTFIYTPDGGFLGDDAFSYTIEDQDGITSNLATVTVRIFPENTPPVAVNDGAATATGFQVTITVLANDSDNDGNIEPTTLTIESQPASGSAQVNPNNGIVTYAANSGFIGRDSFTYSVKDNDGASSNIATVTVAVTEAPQVVTERFSPTDDAQVKVANSPQNFGSKPTGKVEKNRFSIYLKFNVTGLSGQVKSAKVKMKVADFAEDESDDGGSIFPVSNLFKNSDATWDEDGIVFQNAPEVSGSPLDSAGEIKLKQEVFFDVTPEVTGDGTFSFAIVNASNDQGKYWLKEGNFPPELIVETFDFGANQKPVAVDDNAGTRPDQPVTINVTANDLDPDGILDNSTVAVQSQPANGALAVGGTANILTYTPGSGFEGTDTFTYTVEDDLGEVSNVATVTIEVNNNNRPPVAVNDAAATAILSPVQIAILANDTDSDGSLVPASVTITTLPTNGSAVTNTQSGAVTYTPNGGFVGIDAFTYTVEDNQGAVSNEATVTITVSNATTTTVRFQAVHDGQVKHTSPDRNYGSKGTTKIEIGKFSSYFKFNVSGLEGAIRSARLQLTVTTDASDASKDGGTLFPASNDFSGNPAPWTQDLLTFSNAPQTTGAALASTGAVSVTQTVGFEVTSAINGDGIYSFCLTSGSGDQAKYYTREGANPPELVIETIGTGGNIAPVAVDDQATTASGTAVLLDILQNDTDPDGSLVPASVSIQTPPSHGIAAVNANNGVVTFTPATGFSGSDNFTYTVEDNDGAASNEATASITVGSAGGTQSFTFTPAHDGQVKLTAPGINYGTKPTGKIEKGKFDTYLKFNVSGLTGAVTKATLRMKIAQDASDGSDNGGSAYSVSNNQRDVGQAWTELALTGANAPEISGGALSNAGPVAANAQVDLDVTPAISGDGTFSFALTSTSNNQAKYYLREGTFPPELIVTVVSSGGNQAPNAADDRFSMLANLAAVFDVLENDSDADGEIVRKSLTIQNQPGNGTVSVNPHSMLITYAPASGFFGEDTFTYTVDDNDGAASNVATVTITVGATSGSQLLTFEPVADAAVKAAMPTTNYGAADRLVAEAQTTSDAAKEQTTIYLQFDVTGVTGQVQNATVRLHKTSRDLVTANIYRVSNFFKNSDSKWQEEMLVWDNAPILTGKPISTSETAEQDVEFDVSDIVSQNGAYSFAVRLDSKDTSRFDSKEGANGPQLIVVTGGEDEVVSEEMDAIDDEQEVADVLPTEFSLSQNYPNPFNAGTTIRYALPENARVKLRIYNVRGQLVRTLVDGQQEAGFKTMSWLGANDNGRDVASGIYFMQLQVKQKKFVQRMLFQK